MSDILKQLCEGAVAYIGADNLPCQTDDCECCPTWLTPDELNACAARLATLVEAEVVRDFVERVNARAEEDMLAGSPIEGAHHRAIDAELAEVEKRAKEGEHDRHPV